MNFEIEPRLVENLFLKKSLLKDNNQEHKKIRPLLLFLSGGMRGVSGAGVGFALNILGWKNIFDTVVGVSTGAGNAAYFLGGTQQSYIGGEIYYHYLAKYFINFFKKPIADIDYVEWLIKNSTNKINFKAITESCAEFIVAVTDYNNGQGKLIDVKKSFPHMASAIKASIAMLGLYDLPVMVNCRNYLDGCIALPFPIKEVIEKFKPTDILIVANCSRGKIKNKKTGQIEKIIMKLLFRKSPAHLKKLGLTRRTRFIEGYEYFNNLNSINKGIIWSDNNISLLTRDSRKLRNTFYKSAVDTLTFFNKFK